MNANANGISTTERTNESIYLSSPARRTRRSVPSRRRVVPSRRRTRSTTTTTTTTTTTLDSSRFKRGFVPSDAARKTKRNDRPRASRRVRVPDGQRRFFPSVGLPPRGRSRRVASRAGACVRFLRARAFGCMCFQCEFVSTQTQTRPRGMVRTERVRVYVVDKVVNDASSSCALFIYE